MIVFQCPASFQPTEENKRNFRKFFSAIKRGDFYFAWEPRGVWPKEEIKNLCADLDLIHCVDPFKDEPLYGKIVYFRLHGRDSYRYKYTDEDLKNLLEKISKRTAHYIMFNNVFMFEDAIRFSNLISDLKSLKLN